MVRNSKRHRKREREGRPRGATEDERTSSCCAGAWRKVDAGLSEDAVVPGNHYDADHCADSDVDDAGGNPDNHRSSSEDGAAREPSKIQKKRRRHRRLDADQDLEATGGEEMGFFFGLEVISASDYELETDPTTGNKRFRVLKATAQDQTRETKKEASAVPPMKVEEVAASAVTDVQAERTTLCCAEGSAAEDELRPSDDTVSKGQEGDDNEVVTRMQLAWLSATGGVELHPVLCRGLVSLGFWAPTPIQAATLPAAILGQRNIVGAAPTGSGKTLSYLLPILHELLHSPLAPGKGSGRQPSVSSQQQCLQALILSPTRELALQIQQACESLVPRVSAAIVGGLAVAKQTRLLDRKPPIVIGTPGRLWDLISKRAHPHLRELSQVQHLVVDEADRMIQQGSFPELSRIFDTVHLANLMDDDIDDDDDDVDALDSGEGESNSRLSGLPGLPGEARVEMLSADILERIERQRVNGNPTEPYEESDEEAESVKSSDHDTSQMGDEEETDDAPLVLRRTYVYSATLTLPATSSTYKKKRSQNLEVDGAIAEILEKSRARGQTKIVDLSNAVGRKKFSNAAAAGELAARKSDGSDSFQLPPGLSLHHIKCTQKHKDSHLYAYLTTTDQGGKGPCLVFCNSIAAVRRVGATLIALGLDVRILHAQMQQRARFKAVESLQKSSKRAVVVATDVAARGLDIPSVASVVHYDMPRTVDVFVHRSGRTARGIGERAVGSCLSLVSPTDDKTYTRIIHRLKVKVQNLHLDGRLLRAAQARVSLACKVVSGEGEERKVQGDKKWFHDQAAEAGLEVDEGLFESDATTSRNRHAEVRRARAQLAQLLSQPMQTQRYGKFLSTNSSGTSAPISPK